MKPIYVLGAGGLGKEVVLIIDSINKINSQFEIIGFIDHNTEIKTVKIGNRNFTVFNENDIIDSQSMNSNINIALAVGSPAALTKISDKLKKNTKWQFPNLIESSFLTDHDSFSIGEGNIIAARCSFPVDITIGSFNIFNLHVTLGHDSIIGNCNVINPAVNISGNVTIHNQNLIGTNSTVLQGLTINNNCSISAGAFIAKNVENNQIVVGNPARVIGINN